MRWRQKKNHPAPASSGLQHIGPGQRDRPALGLITPFGEALLYDADFTRRLDQLEEVGDSPGYSFFALRKVDIAIRQRNKQDALHYSQRAMRYTPTLPAAHAARTRALIMNGEHDRAFEQLKALEQLRPKSQGDGLEQLLLYQVRFEYNLERDRFDLCKADVENTRPIG